MENSELKPAAGDSTHNRLGVVENVLSGEAAALQRRFIDGLNARTDAENDALYDDVPDSHDGTHYGTDIAKRMFAGAYEFRAANVAAGAPARAYVLDRFKRDMAANRQPDKTFVVFTAGGPGSGKSETLSQGLLNVGDALVFDSTLTKLDTARELIHVALSGGKGVLVSYVHRPVEDAMKFAIERAGKKGMYVEPARLGEDHWKAQTTLITLAKEFADSPDVHFWVFDNRGRRDEIRRIANGVDFFTSPEHSGERYENRDVAIQRAIEADGGEIARRIDARAKSQGAGGDGPGGGGDRGANQKAEGDRPKRPLIDG